MEKDIKKEIDEIESILTDIGRDGMVTRAAEVRFLILKTLVITAKQNEEIIKSLKEIKSNTTPTINY